MNYFENQSIPYAERAVLAEDIELPDTNNNNVSLSYLESNPEYKSQNTEYKDIEGKFYIYIMTPIIDKDEAKEQTKKSPSTKGHTGDELTTSSYTSSNYVTLKIPKYILLNFSGKIPKGTEFIIVSIGGSMDLSNIRIIGVY